MSHRTPSHWRGDAQEFTEQGVLQRRVAVVQLQRVGPPGEVRVAAVRKNPVAGRGLETPVVLRFGRQLLLTALDEELRMRADPVVIGCHVVRNEVEHEPQAARAHPLAQTGQRLVAAEVGVDAVVADGEGGPGDVGVAEIRENPVVFGDPIRIRRRHPARSLAGLPDAEKPDEVEPVARELVQLGVGHVVQRRGTGERLAQFGQPDARIDLEKRGVARRGHGDSLLAGRGGGWRGCECSTRPDRGAPRPASRIDLGRRRVR